MEWLGRAITGRQYAIAIERTIIRKAVLLYFAGAAVAASIRLIHEKWGDVIIVGKGTSEGAPAREATS